MKTFDIALKVKAKHGIIYNYMQTNNLNIEAMAKLIGISIGTMVRIINFKWTPNSYNSVTVKKLCTFFKCKINDLFPKEVIQAIKNDSQIAKLLQEEQIVTKSINLDHLISFSEVHQIETRYEMDIDEMDKKKFIKHSLLMLTETERKIVKMYFGIDSKKEYNMDEIGKEIGKTRARTSQIFVKVMKKLKHPPTLSTNENVRYVYRLKKELSI